MHITTTKQTFPDLFLPSLRLQCLSPWSPSSLPFPILFLNFLYILSFPFLLLTETVQDKLLDDTEVVRKHANATHPQSGAGHQRVSGSMARTRRSMKSSYLPISLLSSRMARMSFG